jgi:hypothetical protein
MFMGWNRKAICLHIVLVAVAIQGVTPDPSDLASEWLYSWAGRAIAHEIVAVNDVSSHDGSRHRDWFSTPSGSLPNDDDCHDDMPDEVCVPAQAQAFGSARDSGKSSRLIPLAADSIARVSRPNHVVLSGTSIPPHPTGTLIHSLCRLIC